jgi:hypothetical protein
MTGIHTRNLTCAHGLNPVLPRATSLVAAQARRNPGQSLRTTLLRKRLELGWG